MLYFHSNQKRTILQILSVSMFLLNLISAGAHADDNSSSQSENSAQEQTPVTSKKVKIKRPKPTFFEQTLSNKENQNSFSTSFLSDALNGIADPLAGSGGTGTGGFSAEFRGISSVQNTSGAATQVVTGSFVKTGSDSANFISNGSVYNFSNFDTSNPITLTINGQSYSSVNSGFSGSSAFGVFNNVNGSTQVFRVDDNIRGLDFDNVPVGTTFQGTLVTGGSSIPDR